MITWLRPGKLSLSAKVRPASKRVRMVSKYPGRTSWKSASWNLLGSAIAFSVPQRIGLKPPLAEMERNRSRSQSQDRIQTIFICRTMVARCSGVFATARIPKI